TIDAEHVKSLRRGSNRHLHRAGEQEIGTCEGHLRSGYVQIPPTGSNIRRQEISARIAYIFRAHHNRVSIVGSEIRYLRVAEWDAIPARPQIPHILFGI